METRRKTRMLSTLLALLVLVALLPDPGRAHAAGPDLKVEYLGWHPTVKELIRFKVTKRDGDGTANPGARAGVSPSKSRKWCCGPTRVPLLATD